ncbi:matrix metalloproteinase-28 isoform X1, partial [Silurus asotus]
GFLEKYGYLHQKDHTHSADKVTSAVRQFQWLSHLPVTGRLDSNTLLKMASPRCGVKDRGSNEAWKRRVNSVFTGQSQQHLRKKRYTRPGGKWYKQHLTYQIVNWPRHLSQGPVRLAVRMAFQLWSNVSGLVFHELNEGQTDIRLAFYEGEHNDGTSNAFDGPGGALAHAFFPCRGEAHFDKAERWTLSSHKGHNLFLVSAHEIGHTLGLEHSPVRHALMSPYYKKLGRSLLLSWDDITAVQQLYDGNGTVLVFRGGLFWTVTSENNRSDPLPLKRRWPQLPFAIEAAAFSPLDGKFYFFNGKHIWRYSGTVLDPGFPKKSSECDMPRHPDCAFFYAPLGHMVVFKGSRYFVLNLETLRSEPYYPRGLADWKGVPRGANGAVTRADGKLYFFLEQQYWSGWDIYKAASEHFVLKADVLEAGGIVKHKDLGEFDKGQFVTSRRLGQSISKTAALVGCSQSAVVSIYQKWSKEVTVVNRQQVMGGRGSLMHVGREGWAVWSDPTDELL